MNYQDIVKNTCVYGLEESVRGAKFPMATNLNKLDCEITETTVKLAQAVTGSGHDNFLNGIIVQFDLTLTNKAWVEAERYHFLDFVSSQSTMHRITKFNLDEAYIEYVDPRMIAIMKEKVAAYNTLQDEIKAKREQGENPIDLINASKTRYLEILYSNPCGFQITARMTTNYRQLKTIYAQRKSHRLPEWHAFCAWVETLPHAEFIVKTLGTR